MIVPHKIKVALILPTVPVYSVPLFSYLSQADDVEITCFYSRGGKRGAKSVGNNLPVPNVMVTALYQPFSGVPLYQCVLKSVITGKFDAVICSQALGNLATLILWMLSPILKYKFLWWGIGFDPYRQKDPSSKPAGALNKMIVSIKDFLWKRADALLVYSQEGRQYSIGKNVKPDKIFVFGNTVDVEQMQRQAQTISGADILRTRRLLHLDENSFAFLFVGRLHRRKEVPFLIKAFSQVADQTQNSKLIIVGDGTDRAKVEELVESLRLRDRVVLLGAVYDSRELAKIFISSDVVTLPGQVGLTVVHSFVYGKPVITKSSDSYSPELEYLKDGVNGINVPNSSLESYAKAMKNIYSDDGYRDALSRQAAETAKQLPMSRMAESIRTGILYAVNS